mgnify:CR=1 FL=1
MTINFLYRSTKENAPLNIRLLFRHNDNDYTIGAKTQLSIYSLDELKENNKLSAKYYWSKQHKLTRVKDIAISNKQAEVNTELNKIENHVLKAVNDTNISQIDKYWLKTQIDKYYNPISENNTIVSNELIKNIDFYKNSNKQLSTGTKKQYTTLKNKLIKYENTKAIKLYVKDINELFKNNFENYCIEQNYSTNTIARNLKAIKTICNYAKRNGVETSLQLDSLKIASERVNSIYLTFDDLNKIENIEPHKLTESLNNAKEWLIISCYVGQRVSDFMPFTDKMIRIEDGKSLIEFTQKKTNKIMTVPLHKKVFEILEKNKGKFPRAISDQKYNDYIKEVCRLAELNEDIISSKKIKLENKQYRNKTKNYKKWELVSSHIGRRSFATNFYGTIPTTFLMAVTGHKTEASFLTYIGKSNKDLAMEISKYF